MVLAVLSSYHRAQKREALRPPCNTNFNCKSQFVILSTIVEILCKDKHYSLPVQEPVAEINLFGLILVLLHEGTAVTLQPSCARYSPLYQAIACLSL